MSVHVYMGVHVHVLNMFLAEVELTDVSEDQKKSKAVTDETL